MPSPEPAKKPAPSPITVSDDDGNGGGIIATDKGAVEAVTKDRVTVNGSGFTEAVSDAVEEPETCTVGIMTWVVIILLIIAIIYAALRKLMSGNGGKGRAGND